MTITITSEPAQVATIVGRLDGSTSSEALSQLLSKLDFTKNVILDLGEVEYISSAGLRTILMICKKTKERSRAFALCGTIRSVDEILQISGFTKLMPVFANPSEAAANLPEPVA